MALHYTAPPICEVVFSGSSNPVIVLSDFPIGQVTGLVLSGEGAFRLSWNTFPGALCYNVYFVGGDSIAVILAQCVTDPFFDLPPGLGPGELIVTPITLDGEGPPSDPLDLPGGGGQVQNVSVTAVCPLTARASFPATFRISRGAATAGNLLVNYTLAGTAINGADYVLISTFATIPNGSNFVFIDITPVEAALVLDKTVILTINESVSYFVESPNSATVQITYPYLRIVDYGGTTPLFFPGPNGDMPNPGLPSSGCEWAGVLNYLQLNDPVPGPEFIYFYRDSDGNTMDGVNEAIRNTTLLSVMLAGPFSGGAVRWQVQILGRLANGNLYVIWQGYKTTGDADGTYQIAGPSYSDLRLTVDFEYFP